MRENSVEAPGQSTQRGTYVLVAVVIAFAFMGYCSGIGERSPAPDFRVGSAPAPESVQRAPSYGKLIEKGPIRAWEGDGGVLAVALAARSTAELTAIPELGDRSAALAARETLRAFDGAPPVIPHEVDQRGLSCMACHREGYVIGERVAPAMSHAPFTSCTQCHAPVTSGPPRSPGLEPVVADSTFEGLRAPLEGKRAWAGAPPEIPHPSFMREACMSCHGGLGNAGLKTSHPWRQSCTQCHAPSADRDQRPRGTP